MGKNFQNLLRNPFSFMREISISTKLLKYHPESLMEPKSFLILFYSQKQEGNVFIYFTENEAFLDIAISGFFYFGKTWNGKIQPNTDMHIEM